MRNLKLIIRREYNARVRNKSFIIMTVLSPLILVGMIFLIVYLSSLNNEEVRTIAVLDQSELLKDALEDSENLKFTFLAEIDIDYAKTISLEGKYHGLLYIPQADSLALLDQNIQFFVEGSPNISAIQYIEKSLNSKLTNLKLEQDGVDLFQIEASKSNIDIHIENFQGEQTSKMSSWIKAIFGGAAGYLLMMFIIIYGNMVMRSVIEEKTNRIIEIIISSVKPYHLMMGKIIGTSLAGITQFLIWVVLGGILLIVATSVFGLQLETTTMPNQELIDQVNNSGVQTVMNDILRLPMTTLIISFLFFFIGGYFLYSSIYAAIGAAVDNETDTQQFMFPIIIPLMLAIYIGFFAVIENPHGTVAVIFSYVPLTSPIVMLMRIPFGVPWWEILISLFLLFATFALVVWFAAKIYRVGILMYGKKPTYKELYKWLKY
ncbi:MAG: ABC transporter permease [Bacteroidetes bacterium HGW-Bacteroidetes-2]|jgi:ABC-2 type transport system permease protein|nr:MAG: ABC transporter permease [Bacteroidetes bacterium HGW-Bacteroidetes-2]